MKDAIKKAYNNGEKLLGKGKVANYIPELEKVDKNALGLSVWDVNNNNYNLGDSDKAFTIQSISKIITLITALEESGGAVFDVVGKEASGESFNSIKKLEEMAGKPENPFINAGAIAVCSTISGNKEQRDKKVLTKAAELLNADKIDIDNSVYLSEKETGDRNRALAYFMRNYGIFNQQVDSLLDSYFLYCSMIVTTKNLSFLGSVLANRGRSPIDDKVIMSEEIVSIVTALMGTAGLYDRSGSFAVEVGLPGKSGVGGGIVAVGKDKMGIAAYCPALDEFGNSIAAWEMLKTMSSELNLSAY